MSLGRLTRARVLWRSLFLQASWNPKGMQNVGFAYALLPALKKLYPEPARLEEAVKRHLAAFNTHPYLAAALLGGTLHHEERIARGEEPPQAVLDHKQALMGPLAALGDGFFWLSLRPAVGALSALSALLLGPWAAVLLLVLYNAVHLTLRAWLFHTGYRLGDGLLEPVGRLHLADRGQELRAVAACSAGAALVGWPALLLDRQPAVAAAAVGAGIFSVFMIGRGVSVYALLYGAAALGLVLGWIVG